MSDQTIEQRLDEAIKIIEPAIYHEPLIDENGRKYGNQEHIALSKNSVTKSKQAILLLFNEVRINELLTYKANLPDVNSTEIWLNTRLAILTQLTPKEDK